MTNCEPINCSVPVLLPTARRSKGTKLLARWRARGDAIRFYCFRARAFRFRRIHHVQFHRSKDMIAISIVCVLLICLFRLDLDEVSSRS